MCQSQALLRDSEDLGQSALVGLLGHFWPLWPALRVPTVWLPSQALRWACRSGIWAFQESLSSPCLVPFPSLSLSMASSSTAEPGTGSFSSASFLWSPCSPLRSSYPCAANSIAYTMPSPLLCTGRLPNRVVRARYVLSKLARDQAFDNVSRRFARQRRIPAPRYVLWDATRRCNLHCLHCGATGERYAQELSTAQVKGVVDQLAALGVGMFAATGGEPLLREDMVDILAYASAKGLKTGLSTNGFLIDEPMADRVRRAGVYSILVSLDGPREVHNCIRGHPASFDRATEALRHLLAREIPLVAVATTVTRWNLSTLDALRDALLGIGVTRWRLAVALPIGRASGPGLHLDGAELNSLLSFVASNRQHLDVRIGENLTFLGQWERRVRDRPCWCPVGLTACCIGVDGHVRGCPEQPDIADNRQGSVLEHSFAEIWQRGFASRRTRAIIATDPDCSKCRSRHDCLGGCAIMRGAGLHCIYQRLAVGRET